MPRPSARTGGHRQAESRRTARAVGIYDEDGIVEAVRESVVATVEPMGEWWDDEERRDADTEVAPVLPEHTGYDGGLSPADVDGVAQDAPAAETPSTVPASSALTLQPVTDEDIDRLWDWVRQDSDRGAAFLGSAATTSRHVHEYFTEVTRKEGLGAARACSVVLDTTHVGFVVLDPLQQHGAACHLYLAPSVRGQASTLLPLLLDLYDTQYPMLPLAIATTDESMLRLVRPHGFELTYVVVRRKAQ